MSLKLASAETAMSTMHLDLRHRALFDQQPISNQPYSADRSGLIGLRTVILCTVFGRVICQ